VKYSPRHFDGTVIDIPDAWTDNSIINFLGPPVGGVQPNLVLTCHPKNPQTTLRAYAREQIGALTEQQMHGFEIVSENQDKSADLELFRVNYRWVHKGQGPQGTPVDVPLRQEQVYFFNQKKACTLTLTCPESAAESLAELFETILTSMRCA
jgi:hypothetical protein